MYRCVGVAGCRRRRCGGESLSGSGATAVAFADGIQNPIMAADRDDLAGWTVDLRGNGGGNLWPMLAGVGPVLGEGIVGYFVDPQGVESIWEYRNSVSFNRGFSSATSRRRID
jgi:hypothetical protein